jgi:HrpA-like RNA helicase
MLIIRQCICSGYIDQVARLATFDEINKFAGEPKIPKGWKCYITQQFGLEFPVFIHPTSFLIKKEPKYVVYSELVKSQKDVCMMRGITEIKESWLSSFGKPLTTLSDPIDTKYNEEKDIIVAFVEPTFGKSLWKLPKIVKKNNKISRKLSIQFLRWEY